MEKRSTMTVRSYTLQSLIKIAIALLFLPALLSSCTDDIEEKMGIKVSDNNLSVYELSTYKLTKVQVELIKESNFSLQELNEKFPAQCVRKKGEAFRVIYVCADNEGLFFLWYDNKGNLIVQRHIKPAIEMKTLDSVEKGLHIKDVMAIDETGDYFSYYASNPEWPKVSEHYTIEGYVFQVKYDDEWKVIDIKYELM